jgi:hypothetical protein
MIRSEKLVCLVAMLLCLVSTTGFGASGMNLRNGLLKAGGTYVDAATTTKIVCNSAVETACGFGTATTDVLGEYDGVATFTAVANKDVLFVIGAEHGGATSGSGLLNEHQFINAKLNGAYFGGNKAGYCLAQLSTTRSMQDHVVIPMRLNKGDQVSFIYYQSCGAAISVSFSLRIYLMKNNP